MNHSFRYKHNVSLFSFLLFIALLFYYLSFAHKGIVFSDEGVYTYTSELISQGKIPYQHFFLEYPPAYFYLLAFLYKIFGIQVIVGRLLSLFFCLLIYLASLKLIHNFGLSSKKDTIITLLCVASFGYPLINIPILTWPSVLLTIILMLLLLTVIKKIQRKYMLSLGLVLALQLALKQNLALTEILLVNFVLFVSLQTKISERLKFILGMNSIWIFITVTWVYYFFNNNNFSALKEFLSFSSRLSTIYAFSYPPLSMIFQSLGFIKLLPYYMPILLLVSILISIIKNPREKKLFVLLLPLTGFFTTIYPVSELLHVIPYFGLVLLTLYIYYKIFIKKFGKIVVVLLTICILSGFYMIHFMGHYRYHAPYRLQTSPLLLPKSKGIMVEKVYGENITSVYNFLQLHSKKTDYIFAFNFSPMQYFLFDRPNPSYFPIYSIGYLTQDEEVMTIKTIQNKTKYIITDGNFGLNTPLAIWIAKQKRIVSYGQYVIYEIKKEKN